MSVFESIVSELDGSEGLLYPTGFEGAVIGRDPRTGVLVLSVSLIIRQLMEEDEMSEEDAIEYYGYNMRDAFLGEGMCIYCEDMYL